MSAGTDTLHMVCDTRRVCVCAVCMCRTRHWHRTRVPHSTHEHERTQTLSDDTDDRTHQSQVFIDLTGRPVLYHMRHVSHTNHYNYKYSCQPIRAQLSVINMNACTIYTLHSSRMTERTNVHSDTHKKPARITHV